MAATVYNFEVEQGATKTQRFQYQDADGLAIDLTGYTGRGQVRQKANSVDDILSLDVDVVVGTDGYIDITVNAADTAALTLRGKTYLEKTVYVYDAEVFTALDADVKRIANGEFRISPEVTKP